MPSNRLGAALRDVKDNIDLAQTFIAGMSFPTFQSDRKTVYAAVRCLEIISEASRRLPAEIKDRHPNIRWNDIASAGNIYRHGYQLVRDDLLWRTVKDGLESLRLVVEEELARLVDR